MNSTVKRLEIIELLVPANSQGRVTFQTVPQLRNQSDQRIIIQRIEVFTIGIYANSQSNNTLPGLPLADVPKAALVLHVNGVESIRMIPIARLMPVALNAAGNYDVFQSIEFEDLENVDFSKSYVQFSSASDAADYVIPFSVSYLRFSTN